MGLDNFWSAAVEGDFNVCGGMFSGHGNESFRGKVYSDLVERVTGVSLYEDSIDNGTILDMADKLEEAAKADPEGPGGEVTRLAQMFRAHADAGHSLSSWY